MIDAHHAARTPGGPGANPECMFPGQFYFDANNTTGAFVGQDIWVANPGSGSQGYVLCFREPVNNILEYAHITVLTNSTINANVIDWASIQAMGGPLVLDTGGTNRPNVDITGSVGTIDANVIEWLGNPVLADASGTPNVNIVDWGGVDASGGTLTLDVDANGYPQVDASTGGIVTSNVEEWLGSSVLADASGVPNVNIVDWGGLDASGGPLTLTADASGYPQVDASVGGIVNSNVEELLGNTVSESGAGIPDVNVADWGGWDASGSLLTLSADVSGYPQIDIMRYAGKPARSSVHGMPDVNVMDWNGLSDASGNPIRSANIAAATTPETGVSGDGSGFPQITVAAWQADLDGDLSNNDVPIYVRHSMGGSNSDASGSSVLLPAITVEGWGGRQQADFEISNGDSNSAGKYPNIVVRGWGSANTSAEISVSPSKNLPNITVKGWSDESGGSDASGNLLDVSENALDVYTTWTRDINPDDHSSADRPNVRTQIIADNAIDESAIEIDSVTYEEISTSAAQEISDAVWNADIFNSIYHPDPTDTSTGYAKEMTIGRAMLVQYLSQNVNHWGINSESPMHTCNVSDASGNRFYSNRLATWPLTSDEIISYIDRAVVIVKGLTFDSVPGGVASFNDATESYLGRITGVDSDSSGQYFEIKLVNEDEDSVPLGLSSGSDILIVKAETDATMHEVAHEVWEESVFDHETADTFGMFSRIMTGLTQFNHRITDSIYDDSGRLLSCRLVVYPTACDAKSGTNALTTVEVTSTYDEKQNMETFLAKEESSDPCPEE